MSGDVYRATMEELFDAEAGASGYERAEIAEAEARIGRALPASLVENYVAFGRRSFQRAHDRLMAPSRLRIQNGMLLFYEENQQVFHWGVPIDAGDDPPVMQSVDDSGAEWVDDHDHLSQFLTTMLFHHRARMTPCAFGRAPPDALGTLSASAFVPAGCHRPLATFHRIGGVAVEIDDFNEDGIVYVLAGARDERELLAFQRAHAVSWT
jgi:hypothetical protein